MTKKLDIEDQAVSASAKKLPYIKPKFLELGSIESVTWAGSEVTQPVGW